MGFAAVRVAGPGRSAEPDRRAVQGRGPGVLVRSQHPDRVLRAAAQLVPDDPAQLLLTRVSPQGMAPAAGTRRGRVFFRSEEHTSELQSREKLVCRLLLEKKKQT